MPDMQPTDLAWWWWSLGGCGTDDITRREEESAESCLFNIMCVCVDRYTRVIE